MAGITETFNLGRYLSQDFLKNLFSYGLIISEIIILGLIIGVGIYYLSKRIKYNKIVHVIEKIGENNIIGVQDSGGIMKSKEGSVKFRLLKRKINLPVPDSRFFIIDKKGKAHIFLYKYTEGGYAPIAISEVGKFLNFTPIEWDLNNWYTQELENVNLKYDRTKAFQKYLPIIMYASMLVFFVIALWIYMGSMKDMTADLIDAHLKLGQMLADLGKAVVPSQ